MIPHFSFTRLISILTIECFFDRCVSKFDLLSLEGKECLFHLFLSSTVFLIIGVFIDVYFLNKTEKRKENIFRYGKKNIAERKQEILKIIENNQISEYALIVEGLEKTFKISSSVTVEALKEINFSIKKGEIFGLLGPNGAGKTTLLSIITGSLNKDFGRIFIGGKNISKDMESIYNKIGVCPQFDALWSDLTIEDHFLFYARIRGVSSQFENTEVIKVLRNMKLEEHKNKMISELSGGMKRRVSIGIAISGDTELVFLDEPTTGLDPINRIQIWKILKDLKKDQSILLTTHLMEEAETLCRRIGILDKGEILCLDYIEDLKKSFFDGFRIKIRFTKNSKEIKDDFLNFLLDFGQVSVERNFEECLNLKFDLGKSEMLKLFEIIEPQTPNPKPQTPNPKPQTPNPKPQTPVNSKRNSN